MGRRRRGCRPWREMRVAVTGATGYVGRFVVADLHAQGWTVQAWARPQSDRTGFAGPVSWRRGDLADRGAAGRLLDGADALVHAAFDHVPGRYRGGEGDDARGFLEANRNGSLRLVEAADRAGLARVVFLSSRAVYGPRAWDRPLDERHPTRPDTLYGRYKLEIEQALAAACRGRAWTSLRATGVHGPGHPLTRSKWFEVVRASLTGEQPPARTGTEVAGDDLARAVRLLLMHPQATAGPYNVSDVVVSNRAVSRLAGGVLAAPAPPPSGIMATDRLQALGWRPVGWAGVETSVRPLVEAQRRSERTSDKAAK